MFSAAKTARGVVLGFQRRGTNDIVAVEECPVLVPAIVSRLGTLREIAALAVKSRRAARIAVVAADNGLDIAVSDGGRPDERVLAALGRLAGDASLARLTVDGREVFMNRRPEIDVGGAALLPPAGGFLQASAAAEAAMAEAVLSHVGDARPVLDLFAGCGTFSLRLATKCAGDRGRRRRGVARCPASWPRAGRTGLKPVTTRRRDLFRNPVSATELAAFAAVVFDPPAAGAKAQAEALAQSTRAEGRGGFVQPGDACPRCAHPSRRRLSP